MQNNFFESDIPSKRWDLLKMMIGQSVTKIVRFSELEINEAVENYYLSSTELFSKTLGPVLIYLDTGMVIGGNSDPSLISLHIWLEKDRNGITDEWPIESDETFYQINAEDEHFGNPLVKLCIGYKIVSVKVLKMKPQNVVYESRPCEVGVVITLDNNSNLLLSHGLHNGTDDFSVITLEQIDPEVKPELYEILNYP